MRQGKSIPGRIGLMNRKKGTAAEVFSFTGKLKAGSLVNNQRTVTRRAVKTSPAFQVERYLIRA